MSEYIVRSHSIVAIVFCYLRHVVIIHLSRLQMANIPDRLDAQPRITLYNCPETISSVS